MAIKWLVPSVSRDLRDRMRREAYVTNEIIIRTELLKAQGTIHILRKHFYSKKLNLTSKFFTKSGFFVKTKQFFSILHFDEISSEILKFLVCKEEINCSKDS